MTQSYSEGKNPKDAASGEQPVIVVETPKSAMNSSQPNPLWKEAIRGAKFGALVAGSIMGVVAAVGVLLSIFMPAIRTEYSKSGVVSATLGFFGGILLSALYGAVLGALIYGCRAAVRARRRLSSDELAN